MTALSLQQLSKFTRAYLTCAYFTNDESEGLGGQDYSKTPGPKSMHEKLSFQGLCAAIKVCNEFGLANAELLAQAGDSSQNGHDLWLTRNRHGSGFWDRGYDKSVSKALTNAAHVLGETDLYEGDDGELYFSR